MSEFLSTAFIQIRAELAKGFRTDLRDKVKRSVGTGFFVPIKPALGAFRADLQREFKKTPFLVTVMPDINEVKFRASLQKQVDKAAAGVTATINVRSAGFFQPPGGAAGVLGGTGGRGGGAGGGGGGGVSKEQREIDALIERRTKAQNALTEASRKGIPVEDQLRALSRARSHAESGLADVLVGKKGVEESEFRNLLNTVKQRETNVKALRTEGQFKKELGDLSKSANANLATEISSITKRNALGELSNKLSADKAALDALSKRATAAGVTAINAETTALIKQIEVREASIATRRQELIDIQKGAGRRAQGLRGFAATGLGFAGLRGATLAAGGPFLAGAFGAAVIAKTISGAADLEKQLNILRVTAEATGDEMEALREKSVELGRDIRLPGVTATDAAKTLGLLVKAGLSVEDSLDAAQGTLQLATAAEIDFADATNLVASALNAFRLEGAEATRVADLFTNAAIESQASVEDMAIALRQSAAAAAIAGVSVEDTVALLTLLARAGLTGSDAGTSLRVSLLRLINPSKEAAAVLKSLDINLRDSLGRIRPEAFNEFFEAQKRLTKQTREQNAAIVFGADGFRTISIVGREGAEGLRQVREEMAKTGSAARVTGAQAQGLSGQLNALASNFQTLGTSIGTFALPPLTLFVGTINEFVSTANAFVEGGKKVEKEILRIGKQAKDNTGPLERFIDASKNFFTGQIRGRAQATIRGIDPTARPRALGALGVNAGRSLVGLTNDSKKLENAVADAIVQVENLAKAFGAGPLRPTALNEFVLALQKMRDEFKAAGPEGAEVAKRIQEIIESIQRTGQIPPLQVLIEVLTDPVKNRTKGQQATTSFIEGVRSQFPAFSAVAEEINNLLWLPVVQEAGKKGGETATAFTASLSTKLAIAEATGSQAEVLAILRQQRAAAAERLARNKARTDLTEKQKNEQITQAANDLKAADDAIQAILDENTRAAEQAKRDAEAAAKKAADLRADRDEAILGRLERRRSRIERRQARAAATEGLGDDIREAKALRDLVHKQINVIREKIKTLSIQRDAIRALQKIEFELRLDIARMVTERRATIRDEIRRGIELDIAFAETTENRAREVSARKRLIRSLEKERDDLLKQKKLTIEQKNRLKEIRNEIAEQRKAIEGIAEERKKMFAEMAFAFLTTQQGFAANLLGNLLPGGAAGGAVGGRATGGGGGSFSVGGGGGGGGDTPLSLGVLAAERMDRTNAAGRIPGQMAEASRRDQAAQQGGFTAAQASTLIHLTKQIVRLLGGVESRTKHPEHKRSANRNEAAMDGMGGMSGAQR